MKGKWMAAIFLFLGAFVLLSFSPSQAQPIENELYLITPVSKDVHDPALKAFAAYAKKKWNIDVKTSAMPQGNPGGLRADPGMEGQTAGGYFLGRRRNPF